jgi:hypothetical protein
MTYRALLIVVAVCALTLFGCGNTTSGRVTSETHFVCATDSDCMGLGDAHACIGGRCIEVAQAGSHALFLSNMVIPDAPDTLTGQCLPRGLTLDATGAAPIRIFAAQLQGGCACDAPGFAPASDAAASIARRRLEDMGSCDGTTGVVCADVCFCELEQLEGTASDECRNGSLMAPGFCYVDPTQGLGTALAPLLDYCAPSEQRLLLLSGAPLSAGTVLVDTYVQHTPLVSESAVLAGAVGARCTPRDEMDSSFSGFGESEVGVDIGSPKCSTGVCLANHFRGRVSCPYGQTQDEMASASTASCMVPGSATQVAVPVTPQLVGRRASDTVYCSCRCGGSGPGPFCACPSGYECSPVVPDVGIGSSSVIEGSYCIKAGTTFDPDHASVEPCSRTEANCEEP